MGVVALTINALMPYQDQLTVLLLDAVEQPAAPPPPPPPPTTVKTTAAPTATPTGTVKRDSTDSTADTDRSLQRHASEQITRSQPQEKQPEQEINPANSQTGNNDNNNYKNNGEVYFLDSAQVSMADGFSATWLQSKESFYQMNLHDIDTCEDASFYAYSLGSNGTERRRVEQKMRMTLDWMDWSVEHMSKWWKISNWDVPANTATVWGRIKNSFDAYIQDGVKLQHLQQSQTNNDNTPTTTPLLHRTVAGIAYQDYKNGGSPQLGVDLTALSLGATIESLRRAGFGRITIGLLRHAAVSRDIEMISNLFATLAKQYSSFPTDTNNINNADNSDANDRKTITLGATEIGYTFVSETYIKTKTIHKNMPRAVLFGLKDALRTADLPESQRAPNMTEVMTGWLGTSQNPSYWQYVYLTEPDTLLQTRPSSLPAIKEQVDNGMVLLPHRWQPIPHESDVLGLDPTGNNFLTQEEFPEVIDLEPYNHNSDNHDACCDEHAGPVMKPGKYPSSPKCLPEIFWYACGFHKHQKHNATRHFRLHHYELVRLIGGAGIVTIAGSEHGRRCIPKTNEVCRPPTTVTSELNN